MAANPNVRGIRLTIPSKDKPAQRNNLDTIERWANSQVVNQLVAGTGVTLDTQAISAGDGNEGTGVVTINASGSGGAYASLTGAGETSTPGDLQQEGGLFVDVPSTSTIGFIVSNASTHSPINILDSGGEGINIETTGNIGLFLNSGTGTGGTNIQDSGTFGIIFTTNLMGFFSTTPIAQPTVTGSRGGNVALASLLTALANLGLIIDTSTP